MEFEIYKDTGKKYITIGAVLIRIYKKYRCKIEVTSEIYIITWNDGSKHEKFNCITDGMNGDYYVDDLFHGDRVLLIKKSGKQIIEENDEIVISSKEI